MGECPNSTCDYRMNTIENQLIEHKDIQKEENKMYSEGMYELRDVISDVIETTKEKFISCMKEIHATTLNISDLRKEVAVLGQKCDNHFKNGDAYRFLIVTFGVALIGFVITSIFWAGKYYNFTLETREKVVRNTKLIDEILMPTTYKNGKVNE